MEIPEYKYKYWEMLKWYERLLKAKNSISTEDSFHEYRDYLKTFFRVNYELKENLKYNKGLQSKGFGGYNGLVEKHINSNKELKYAIDIANKLKGHDRRTKRSHDDLGAINAGVNFDKNKTELTLSVNNRKINAITLAEKCMERWKAFFLIHDL